MRLGDALIYAGRIRADGLLSVPHLLRREVNGSSLGNQRFGPLRPYW